MTTRKTQPDDQPVEVNNDLPDELDSGDFGPNQDLPEEADDETPTGTAKVRGKSEEAHARAPGQQKKRKDPNSYPDPKNLPHTP